MTITPPDPPWLAVPTQISEMLRPRLTDVVEEVIAAVAVAVPAYARPLEGRFGDGVRQGVEVALGRFLELPGTTEPALETQTASLTPRWYHAPASRGRGVERGVVVAASCFLPLFGRRSPKLRRKVMKLAGSGNRSEVMVGPSRRFSNFPTGWASALRGS